MQKTPHWADPYYSTGDYRLRERMLNRADVTSLSFLVGLDDNKKIKAGALMRLLKEKLKEQWQEKGGLPWQQANTLVLERLWE